MIFIVAGIAFLARLTTAIVHPRPGSNTTGLVALWIFALCWLGGALRLYRSGVYVSSRGLRIINPVKTTTLTWPAVERIYLGRGMTPWPINSWHVWIAPADRPPIQTVLAKVSPDFLGRGYAFDQAYQELTRHWQESRQSIT